VDGRDWPPVDRPQDLGSSPLMTKPTSRPCTSFPSLHDRRLLSACILSSLAPDLRTHEATPGPARPYPFLSLSLSLASDARHPSPTHTHTHNFIACSPSPQPMNALFPSRTDGQGKSAPVVRVIGRWRECAGEGSPLPLLADRSGPDAPQPGARSPRSLSSNRHTRPPVRLALSKTRWSTFASVKSALWMEYRTRRFLVVR
jgi:hypothetical protein